MLRLVCKAQEQPRERVREMAEELCISPRTAELLLSRGITDCDEAANFLNPSESALENAYLLKDMDKTVSRIRKAIDLGEKIVVFGDYDADGVCATAIMLSCLRRLGANAEYMIPSRHEDGYGMTMKSAEQLFNMGANLIITVDNGVKSAAETERCYELGMEVIVTDHHIPGDTLPKCEALILCGNADEYPNRHICGAGLACKVAEALLGREAAREYIPLAGIATVADIVPLTGENRVFAALAVKDIRRGKCPEGIKALCSVSQTKLQDVSAGDFGFRIAPRLNAASRIEEADAAVSLLMETERESAAELAAKLDELNAKRKAEESGIFNAACEKLANEDLTKRRCIVLHGEDWNAGVIGIAAARIAERFYRPTVLLSGKDTVTGSCRSISGVNIHDALSSCERFFSRFGGHAYAAGLTMQQKDIDEFRAAMDDYLWHNEPEEKFIPSAQYDFEMELGGITKRFAEELSMLEPFGAGNPQPVVLSRGVRLANMERIGCEGKHVRCHVTRDEQYINAVYFNSGAEFRNMLDMDRCDAVYTPNINTFMGRSELQLNIKNLRCAEPNDVNAWIDRQKGKFVDAICRNVLYNNTRAVSGLAFADTEEKLIELVDASAMDTIALCFTAAGAKRLCTLLKARGIWNRMDVSFGSNAKSICAYNAAVLAPNIADMDISRYKNIIVFDTATSSGIPGALRQMNGDAALYAAKPNAAETEELIAGIPRDRADFIALYKALRCTVGKFYNINAMADALCAATNAPRCHCALAADVFYELGFVTKGSGGIRVEKDPPKRSLEESRTFFALNSLREMNDMYLQLYEEANHEA